MAANRPDDRTRNVATVKRISAARGYCAQGLRKFRIAQQGARRLGCTLSVEEIRAGRGFAGDGAIPAQQGMQAGRQRKAVFGEINRRLKQPRPGQPAVFAVRDFEQADDARRADRAAAGDRVTKRHRLAVAHKQIGRYRGGRGFTAVIGAHHAAGGLVVQQVGAAAQA